MTSTEIAVTAPEIGTAIFRDQLDKPMDLAANLERFQKNRLVVLKFCRQLLVEAAYDEKGYLVPGQLNDFYLVPGAKTKALTKKGSENLAQLFRYFRGPTAVVSETETREYLSATVNVTLVDHYGRVVGNATASCTTAEKGFSSPNAQKKYGAVVVWRKGADPDITTPADFRAAKNDVVARASKRAFVQAVIYATATDEVFHVADDMAEEVERKAPAAASGAVLPFDTKGYKKGTPLSALADQELISLKAWALKSKRHKGLADVIDDLLDERRPEALDADDGLPPI